MGVYIKGMEMPKEGNWVTLRVFPDGQCFIYSWCGNDFCFMEHLTAVPVPPHGRLIDTDELEAEFKKLLVQDNWYYNALHHAPTVIQAEEAEE